MAQDPFEPYLQQADDLFAAGDVVKAGQIWQAILKRMPTHKEAKAGLARVKLHFGVRATQGEDSRSTLSRASAGGPQEVSPLLDQGTALYDSGQIEDALRVWERLLQEDPWHALARGYVNMARSLLGMPLLEPPSEPPPQATARQREEEPQATTALLAHPPTAAVSAALEPDPEDEETLLRNGCLLFDMGQPEDALLRWEQLLARNPDHAQAREYIRQVRAQLQLPPKEGIEPATPRVSPSASPASTPAPAPEVSDEEAWERRERLVREGVQLYDMGMTEEAIEKWEAVLAEAPTHTDAQGYLAMARRQPIPPTGMAAQAPAPPPPPPPPQPVDVLPPTRAELRRDIQSALTQADRLLQLRRFEEAMQLYDRVLQADPQHPQALQGYQQTRTLLNSVGIPEPDPELEPQVESEPERQLEAPPLAVATPTLPPAAVTQRAPQARTGLQPPAALRNLQLPGWLLSPRLWLIGVGVLLASLVITLLVNRRMAEAKLRHDVAAAKEEALQQAVRATQVPVLREAPEAIRKDAETQVGRDPLMGYLRAQALLLVQPDDPAGLALRERAQAALLTSPTPPEPLTGVERLIKEGNLEGAHGLLLAHLRQSPDDLLLRARVFRLTGVLAQLHATQQLWEQAKDDLFLMRALAPQDSSVGLRLRVLEAIPSLPQSDRKDWIALLG